MDHAFDVPDSTDWLNTPLSGLSRVESSLRCQVCKDLFDNPVITTCCHTFCSLCIRRCLSAEGKCPTCRSSDQELKLRRNWAVQEVVDSFRAARPPALEFARREAEAVAAVDGDEAGAEGPALKKRKVDTSDPVHGSAAATGIGRRTRAQSKREESNGVPAEPTVIEDSEASADEEYQPDDGLVACPVCGRRMKNEAVFLHLDRCTGLDSKPASTTESRGPLRFPISRTSSSSTSMPPKRLPTINYSLLRENDLRKKLRDLGIPDSGSKALLQRRHAEWLNLWNANCDSKTPKSKRELLRELDVWERTQGGQASGGQSTVMRKDFDGVAWSSVHGDEFKQLIVQARKKHREVVDSADGSPPKNDDGAGEDANGAEQPQPQPPPDPQTKSQPVPEAEPEVEPPERNIEHHAECDQDFKESNDQDPEESNHFGTDNQIIVVDDAIS